MYVKLVRKHPEIALIPKEDYDFHPYMFASDTVISDTSSALAICLALGRIGVIGDFPYPRMKHSDGWPIVAQDPGEYLKGIFVHMRDVSELMSAVDEAMNPSAEQLQKLMLHREYYFTGLDGKAGERAKDIIEETLEAK
jgi:hypothetical protein